MDSANLLLILLFAAFAALWIPEPGPRRSIAFGAFGAALLLAPKR